MSVAETTKPTEPIERSAGEILKGNIEFRWDKPDVLWCGLDQEDLRNLTVDIAGVMRITPEQAAKIKIIFGDEVKLVYEDETFHENLAMCVTNFDDADKVEDCLVIVNRSKELAQKMLERGLKHRGDEISHYQNVGTLNIAEGDKDLKCEFLYPHEEIVWLISEELNHAKLSIMAGSREVKDQRDLRYNENLLRRGVPKVDLYSVDLMEITASRTTLRVLATLFAPDTDRTEYFRGLLKESLEKGVHVCPYISQEIIDTSYVSCAKN